MTLDTYISTKAIRTNAMPTYSSHILLSKKPPGQTKMIAERKPNSANPTVVTARTRSLLRTQREFGQNWAIVPSMAKRMVPNGTILKNKVLTKKNLTWLVSNFGYYQCVKYKIKTYDSRHSKANNTQIMQHRKWNSGIAERPKNVLRKHCVSLLKTKKFDVKK